MSARAAEERRQLAAQSAEQDRRAAERFQSLAQRFGERNARLIVEKTLWQGATGDMIREMHGDPVDASRRVYKTRTTETWKYEPIDAKHFALQIILENDVCVGWKTS